MGIAAAAIKGDDVSLFMKALEDPIFISLAVLIAGLLFKWLQDPMEKGMIWNEQGDAFPLIYSARCHHTEDLISESHYSYYCSHRSRCDCQRFAVRSKIGNSPCDHRLFFNWTWGSFNANWRASRLLPLGIQCRLFLFAPTNWA